MILRTKISMSEVHFDVMYENELNDSNISCLFAFFPEKK